MTIFPQASMPSDNRQLDPLREMFSPADAYLVRLIPPGTGDWLIPLGAEPLLLSESAALGKANRGEEQDELLVRFERRHEGWIATSGSNQPRTLHSGDRIVVGRALLKFLTADDPETKHLAAVYAQSSTDPLTGVFSRRCFLESLQREIARVKRRGGRLAVLLVDLDGFKAINDRHGHLEGDRVLREVARRLIEATRRDEVLCRFGGDEFALLAHDAGPVEAAKLARRVQEVLEKTAIPAGQEVVHLSASIGMAYFDQSGNQTAMELIARADQQLYLAKQRGQKTEAS
jgi:diguanylate cyclase (GGDEF)-like protein